MAIAEGHKETGGSEEENMGTVDGELTSQERPVAVRASNVTVEGETSNDQLPVPAGASSNNRPLTRSQTGRVPKRRRRDDTPPPAAAGVRKKASAPRKKSKAPAKPLVDVEDEDASGEEYDETPPPESVAREGSSTAAPSTQLTFMDGSSSSTGVDRRGPRPRALLPVPVPNLTKKSRGRRVPTKLATGIDNSSDKETRLYVCKVETCGKCFNRGEHLKRHIRSIHTHEKPFKCDYLNCGKNFNRHDNLLQHIKVHKCLENARASQRVDSESPPPEQSVSPPPSARTRQRSPPRRYSPVNEAYDASINQARLIGFHRPPSFKYPASYSSTSEPTSFATNMAVSSLRTEIPHSPPTSRKYDMTPVHQRYPVGFAN